MTTFISLLRGINVSGQKQVRMDDLRRVYETLGLVNVRSYLQSGNIVFETDAVEAAALEAALEEKIAGDLGISVPILVRSAGDMERIQANNPFLAQRNEDPERLYVTFLKQTPPEITAAGLNPPAGVTDEFSLVNREAYLFCPNGYGRTKLSNTWFERKLKLTCTTRNWKTVTALCQMARE